MMWKTFAIALALLLAASLGVGCMEKSRHDKTRVEFAQFKTSAAQQERGREQVAREDAQEVARLQARHAANQQELIHAFYEAQLVRARRAPTRAADNRSVWNLANHYAASRGREAEGDSASCRAAKAGLREITPLLAEAYELAGEGEDLIAERDDELHLWIGISGNDRALTAP